MHQPLPSLAARAVAVAVGAAALLGACGDDSSDAAAEAASTTTSTPSADTSTSTTTTSVPAEAGEATDPDADAAASAVTVVFDSSVPFDDKVALIEGGEAHRADHEAYLGAAEGVGGITLEATEVAVDGDRATVTYTILFAGSPVYEGQTIDVASVDGTWIVPTDSFCGFLASARTPCES